MTEQKNSGNILNIECNQVLIPEFNSLLWGKPIDGRIYFDATNYLDSKENSDVTLQGFFKDYNSQINSLGRHYNLTEKQWMAFNKDGHCLIDSRLCFLFLSYVETEFLVYVNQIVRDTFLNGFALSDAKLIDTVLSRFTKEYLIKLLHEID